LVLEIFRILRKFRNRSKRHKKLRGKMSSTGMSLVEKGETPTLLLNMNKRKESTNHSKRVL
jgi:hypothetical protein